MQYTSSIFVRVDFNPYNTGKMVSQGDISLCMCLTTYPGICMYKLHGKILERLQHTTIKVVATSRQTSFIPVQV